MAVKENAPFAFATDKVAFSRAVEELRAEKADLNDPAVIEARYNEILNIGSKKAVEPEKEEVVEDVVAEEAPTDAEEEKKAKNKKAKNK